MSQKIYRGEIRDSLIRDLLEKVKKQNYEKYLLSMRLENIRLFHGSKINFDFPVTALIGPNGGGKTTILSSIAIIHKSIQLKNVFRKSRVGDDSMNNWEIEYELIDKSVNPQGSVRYCVTLENDKWDGINSVNRPIKSLGINRTVPALENATFAYKKKLTSHDSKGESTTISTQEIEEFNLIKKEVERILGKSLGDFKLLAVNFSTTKKITQKQKIVNREFLDEGGVRITKIPISPIVREKVIESKNFVYVGDNKGTHYSEFHFGAGEASVIRMVAEIENMPVNSIILIDEIENGLHPLAVKRLVEYLMDVSKRNKLQIIFTTHSDYAIAPLPPEAIWASLDGKLEQGFLSIDSLKAVTGRIDKKLAIFVEDDFAKGWVEAIIRETIGERIDEIGVYPVHGDGNAINTHLGHLNNPSINFPSICFLDGDSKQKEDFSKNIFRLPGSVPEITIFNSVYSNIENNIALLTVACQRAPSKQTMVKNVIQSVSQTTRDPHILFSKIGVDLGFISEEIIKGAFFSLWIQENPSEADKIAKSINACLNY